MNPAWQAFFQAHEWEFNEEYSHALAGKKRIECLPADGCAARPAAGWFLTWADTEAGEWNLAHPFGHPSTYLTFLPSFPAGEWQLLIPEADLETARQAGLPHPTETLVWHREPDDLGADRLPMPECDLRFQGDNAYFLRDGTIASLVKAIHVTPRTVEAYVETVPDSRGKGLATALLQAFSDYHRAAGRSLIYVVATTNAPSLRVAQKFGLKPYQRLSRVAVSVGAAQ